MADSLDHPQGMGRPNKDACLHDLLLDPIRLGSWMAAVGREARLTDEEVAGFQRQPAAESASPFTLRLD